MANFQAVYYRDKEGNQPVKQFLQTLDDYHMLTVEDQIEMLNYLSDQRPHLPFPHSSQIEGDLRELRCHYGSTHYRILYKRSNRLLILLHIFTKTTKKAPKAEIEIAKKRWLDFKARMNATRRKRPRAVGGDAP